MRFPTFLAACASVFMALPAAAETLKIGPYDVDVTYHTVKDDSVMSMYTVTSKELGGVTASGSSVILALGDYASLMRLKGKSDGLASAETPSLACGPLKSYKLVGSAYKVALKGFENMTFQVPQTFVDAFFNDMEADTSIGLKFIPGEPALVIEATYGCYEGE